ncbi:hypothetical protein [Fortiea contorta]|uniref:hypothetical protein n=1 Tax=Fortiea contorta TaxID=1892405 RepID=UPI000349A485|nr:hypothetical protein [Fortiea contorta]
MSLPQNFNEWEHLQDTVRRWHNKAVNQYFSKTPADSLETPKASLRVACTMKDGDTSTMTMMRMWLFEVTAGRLQSVQAPVYGIPVTEHQRGVEFKPQVKLYFRERLSPTSDRLNPATGEITFRLMNETGQSYTRAKAEEMARDVKREFGEPIFVWDKGIYYYYYRDFERGYDLRLLVKSKSEGERIAKKVLAIQNHPFNDDFSDFQQHTRTYSMNPGIQTIYGQSVKKPIKRPTVEVRFRYAQLLLHGRIKVINLVATPEAALKQVIQRLNII